MDDDQFLGYCSIHSETPRALFHAEHLRRLLALADEPIPAGLVGSNGWFSAFADVVHPLVERAQQRLASCE